MRRRVLGIGIGAVTIVALVVVWALMRHSQRGRSINKAVTVVVPLETEVESLDPANLRNPVTSRVVWQIFEGLVGLDELGKPEPMLAESWESSDDFRDWTFHIRNGVKYHPDDSFGQLKANRCVQADDVKFSYYRHAKRFGSFVFGGVIEGFDDFVQGKKDTIAGIDVTKPDEIRFHLTQPEPSFLYRLTSPYLSIMPPEVVESHGTDWGVKAAIGTGPYRLESFSPTRVVLSRFNDYWRSSKGNVERLEFRTEKNQELLFRRLERDDYHVAVLPGTRIGQYLQDGGLREQFTKTLRLDSFHTYNTHYLVFDVRRVPDLMLRRTVAEKIDRDEIVGHLLQGKGRASNSIAPHGMLGYEAVLFPKRGPSAVTTSPPTSAASTPLSLLVSNQQDGPEIAQVIQSQLSGIGVPIKIEVLGAEPFISRVFSDNRPDIFLVSSEWVFSAPELLMTAYSSKGIPNPNLSGYTNPEVDALIKQLEGMSDRAALNTVCHEIESKALQDAPIICLFNRDLLILSNKHLSGLRVNAHNYWDFTDATWKE